eukprot:287857-Chlamydomonas_euryale.AAC.1
MLPTPTCCPLPRAAYSHVLPTPTCCPLPRAAPAPCSFRGYFVPPRPEKNVVEGQRMTDAFVEERRVALERYMLALAAHPTIATVRAPARMGERPH